MLHVKHVRFTASAADHVPRIAAFSLRVLLKQTAVPDLKRLHLEAAICLLPLCEKVIGISPVYVHAQNQ